MLVWGVAVVMGLSVVMRLRARLQEENRKSWLRYQLQWKTTAPLNSVLRFGSRIAQPTLMLNHTYNIER